MGLDPWVVVSGLQVPEAPCERTAGNHNTGSEREFAHERGEFALGDEATGVALLEDCT